MKTLVVVGQYRNQYHHGSSAGGAADRFGCSPSKGFRDISCRFFQSESGIRPNPLKSCDAFSSVDEKACSSPKTPAASVGPKFQEHKRLTNPFRSCDTWSSVDEKGCSSPKTPAFVGSKFQEDKRLPSNGKSNAIPITSKPSNQCRSLIDEFAYSELWAGPAYSNSPPPSSLPIPKFSLRQKRSASFELPVPSPNSKIHSLTKSAPPSPGREACPFPSNSFLSTASATKDLRRILHLDVGDE